LRIKLQGGIVAGNWGRARVANKRPPIKKAAEGLASAVKSTSQLHAPAGILNHNFIILIVISQQLKLISSNSSFNPKTILLPSPRGSDHIASAKFFSECRNYPGGEGVLFSFLHNADDNQAQSDTIKALQKRKQATKPRLKNGNFKNFINKGAAAGWVG